MTPQRPFEMLLYHALMVIIIWNYPIWIHIYGIKSWSAKFDDHCVINTFYDANATIKIVIADMLIFS